MTQDETARNRKQDRTAARGASGSREAMPFAPDTTSVAVLGTGAMGAGMARCLLRAGFGVTVWNRTRSRAEPLADDGAVVAASATAAVGDAQVVISMLFDEDALRAVVEDVLPHLHGTPVWVQSGTIGPAGTARIGQVLGDAVELVDAPVLGTRKPAEDGALTVLAAGAASTLDRLAPVWSAIASRTVVVGDRPGPASALKLAVNAWIATITAATAQSLAIADALAVDPSLFLRAIHGAAVDTPYAQLKGTAMLERSFDPQFTVDGVRKDVGLMLEATAGAVPDELLTAVQTLFARAAEDGHGDDDMAAVTSAFATEH